MIRKRYKTTCDECDKRFRLKGTLKLIGATLSIWSADLDDKGHVVDESKVVTQRFNQADREYLMCMICQRQCPVEEGGWDVLADELQAPDDCVQA